jgi:hypothetical protein
MKDVIPSFGTYLLEGNQHIAIQNVVQESVIITA